MSVLENTPPGSTLNFSQRIKDGGLNRRQSLVILICGLIVLVDGMDTGMLGLIAHDLMRALRLPISAFGAVFSLGLIGAVIGALVMSPVADRWLGRKLVLISSIGVAGLCTLLTAYVDSLDELVAVRLLTGIALGAALPVIFSLAAEFSPRRLSRRVIALLVAFMPLGSLLGGLLGRIIVPWSDWRMLLSVAGVITLVLTVAAAVVMPESVYFLVRLRRDQQRAIAAVRKLFPVTGITVVTVDDDGGPETKADRQPVATLFQAGLWKLTLLFWLAYIMDQGILYFVLGWTPALLLKSGMSFNVGMDAAAMFGIGGAIGTVAQGWLTTRFGIYKVMFVEIGLYVAAMLLMPLAITNASVAPVMVFVISATICAYHAGALLLVIESYPEAIRSTGLGWGLGVGRIGASTAPALAGFLLGIGWSPAQLFIGAAVPGIVTGAALIGISVVRNQRARRLQVRYVPEPGAA